MKYLLVLLLLTLGCSRNKTGDCVYLMESDVVLEALRVVSESEKDICLGGSNSDPGDSDLFCMSSEEFYSSAERVRCSSGQEI